MSVQAPGVQRRLRQARPCPGIRGTYLKRKGCVFFGCAFLLWSPFFDLRFHMMQALTVFTDIGLANLQLHLGSCGGTVRHPVALARFPVTE